MRKQTNVRIESEKFIFSASNTKCIGHYSIDLNEFATPNIIIRRILRGHYDNANISVKYSPILNTIHFYTNSYTTLKRDDKYDKNIGKRTTSIKSQRVAFATAQRIYSDMTKEFNKQNKELDNLMANTKFVLAKTNDNLKKYTNHEG